jgi:hypothetical protein
MAGYDYQSAGSAFGDIAGFGMQAFGAFGAAGAAGQAAAASKAIAQDEMAADQQRRTAMELSARRQSVQDLRMNQRARAMATQNATTQGAQFGSGLAGGIGSISGQSGNNQLGISQNLQIGENLFNINQQIDAEKMAEADAKSKEATFGAIGGLGKGLGSVFGDIGKFAMIGLPFGV